MFLRENLEETMFFFSGKMYRGKHVFFFGKIWRKPCFFFGKTWRKPCFFSSGKPGGNHVFFFGKIWRKSVFLFGKIWRKPCFSFGKIWRKPCFFLRGNLEETMFFSGKSKGNHQIVVFLYVLSTLTNPIRKSRQLKGNFRLCSLALVTWVVNWRTGMAI